MFAYENAEIEKLQIFFYPPVIVGDEATINIKIESEIVKEISKDGKLPSDVDYDDNDIPIAKTTEETEQENIIQNSLFLETKLKKDERDFETVNKFIEEGTRELIQTITNPDYEPIFNNIINVNDWTNKMKEDQEIREPKLDRHKQQNFNAVADVMIRENNANILPQMLANNKIRDSLFLEETIAQQEQQNKQLSAQMEPKLDVYLGNNNVDNEVISGPEAMYIDYKYEDSISRIFCKNPVTVNNSVTAESVEDMFYLDTNSRSCPRLKRHQKELLLIESENKKPKKRLKLYQKQLKDEAKMTRLCKSKCIAQIKEGIKKSEEENDDTEISSNFPIRDKLKPLYKGKLILEKNKELEGLSIEKLCVEKFYHANISMN